MAAQHPNAALRPQEQDLPPFQQLEDYAWHSDPEFQSGLQAILGPNPSAEQAEHLTLRARCFYFARKNRVHIDFDAYQSWRSHQSSSRANGKSVFISASIPSSISNSPPRVISTAPNGIDTTPEDTEATAPYPISFSQIVELIANGNPIPGVKDVPDTVLEGQASQPIMAKRRKPWENDDASANEEFGGASTSVAKIA